MLAFFVPSLIITALALGAVYVFFGATAFLIAALLVVLEVTLSFDNAVVNAQVLKRMSVKWQNRFLTWGILIAVFGTRLILPVLIVSAVAWTSPLVIAQLALFDPAHYGELLEGARYAISSFGAAFLLLVSLKYFLDKGKTTHWIRIIEENLTLWGRIEAIEIVLVLATLSVFSFLVPDEVQATVMVSGVIGVIIFIMMQGIMNTFSLGVKNAEAAGLALFAYLNILDSAFSLDSVVGAFALTSGVVIIAVGLGAGAYFVRSLTLYMVRKKTLDTLVFLEHGAHWAIFGLAASMFASLLTEVPEIVTGTIGLFFVVAAYYSSLKFPRPKNAPASLSEK